MLCFTEAVPGGPVRVWSAPDPASMHALLDGPGAEHETLLAVTDQPPAVEAAILDGIADLAVEGAAAYARGEPLDELLVALRADLADADRARQTVADECGHSAG